MAKRNELNIALRLTVVLLILACLDSYGIYYTAKTVGHALSPLLFMLLAILVSICFHMMLGFKRTDRISALYSLVNAILLYLILDLEQLSWPLWCILFLSLNACMVFLRFKARAIFNPVAFASVLTYIWARLFTDSNLPNITWDKIGDSFLIGASTVSFSLLVMGLSIFLITTVSRRFIMAVSFVATSFCIDNVWQQGSGGHLYAIVTFFTAAFLITDFKTTPDNNKKQMLWGALAGICFSISYNIDHLVGPMIAILFINLTFFLTDRIQMTTVDT